MTTLRAVLNAAVEDELTEHNPAQGLGRFVKSEKATREATSLKPKEVERLLAAARADFGLHEYALVLAAVRTGLREGELAALKWGDIQFGASEDDQDRYVLVQRNYDRRWSRRMLTPKSRKPRRVDMSRELRRVLLELRDERLVKAFEEGKSDIGDELVFPSEVGTPIELNNFSERVFKPLLARAGPQKDSFPRPAPLCRLPDYAELGFAVELGHLMNTGVARCPLSRQLGIVSSPARGSSGTAVVDIGSVATSLAIERCGLFQSFLLEGEIGIEINLGGFYRLVTQPEGNHGTIHTSLQQLHGRRMTKYMRRHSFLPQ